MFFFFNKNLVYSLRTLVTQCSKRCSVSDYMYEYAHTEPTWVPKLISCTVRTCGHIFSTLAETREFACVNNPLLPLHLLVPVQLMLYISALRCWKYFFFLDTAFFLVIIFVAIDGIHGNWAISERKNLEYLSCYILEKKKLYVNLEWKTSNVKTFNEKSRLKYRKDFYI